MSVWHAKPTAGVQLCCRRIQNSQVLAQSCLVSSCGHTAALPPALHEIIAKNNRLELLQRREGDWLETNESSAGYHLFKGNLSLRLRPHKSLIIVIDTYWYYTFHYCPPMHMSTWGELLLRKNQAALDIFRAQDLYAQKPAFDPREAIPFGHSRSLASKSYKYSHCLLKDVSCWQHEALAIACICSMSDSVHLSQLDVVLDLAFRTRVTKFGTRGRHRMKILGPYHTLPGISWD